jgi:hypothetical protein
MDNNSTFLMDILELRVCPECTIDIIENDIHFLDDYNRCDLCGRDYDKEASRFIYDGKYIAERPKKRRTKKKKGKS